MRCITFAAVLAVAIVPASAQPLNRVGTSPAAAGACIARYPAGFRGWPFGRLRSGKAIPIGRSTTLPARPIANVRLAIAPSRPLTGTHYAAGTFLIVDAGVYKIAAGGVGAAVRPLWLDVAGADNAPLASTAHAHGPDCTSITKIVEFRLKPGRYTLLATGLTSGAPVRAMVVAK